MKTYLTYGFYMALGNALIVAGVVVAAAGEEIPDDLLTQMRSPSRLLAPIAAAGGQALHLVERTGAQSWQLTVLDAVRFVPLRSGTS